MVYEYICQKCDEKHDVVKSVEEVHRPEYCPKCGDLMKRIYSVFGWDQASLKGPGWYGRDKD